MAPAQIALMVGTFGESALIRAGLKIGIEGAPAVALTVSKLMQVQFASSMAEGAVAGTTQAIDAAKKGDWQTAGESAIEGLVSGVMAKGRIGHEIASEKVHRDLDETSQAKHGVPFNKLDPYHQGEVIHETVRKSPEYKAVVDQAQDANRETVRKAEKRFSDYRREARGLPDDERARGRPRRPSTLTSAAIRAPRARNITTGRDVARCGRRFRLHLRAHASDDCSHAAERLRGS